MKTDYWKRLQCLERLKTGGEGMTTWYTTDGHEFEQSVMDRRLEKATGHGVKDKDATEGTELLAAL